MDGTPQAQPTDGVSSSDGAVTASATANGQAQLDGKANPGSANGASHSMADSIQVLPANNTVPTMPLPHSQQPPPDGDTIAVNPAARGRGRGRPRPKARGSTGRKRKRDDDEESDDSEVCAPTATTTKSGRAVQRPTSFAPPPVASPVTTPAIKKKRVWRRNPENAVCKICLRGVSPANNMIVFCDGCNTPYHRWCHHPPIDQSVIEETDKEWYCRQCQREKIVPVPEADIAHFVAAGGSTTERQKFFSSLTPGALVTLLSRATALYPQLPVFDPEYASKHPPTTASTTPVHVTSARPTDQPATIYVDHDDEDEDEGYGPEEHPAHYVRPGKGLMSTLPPDKDDEQYLVDEENGKGVFHHLYIVDEKAANAAVSKKPGK